LSLSFAGSDVMLSEPSIPKLPTIDVHGNATLQCRTRFTANSSLKTLLVVVIFMKLLASGHLVRFTAAAGLFWLALLFALGATDYLTRTTAPTGSYTRGPVAEGGS
jgi:hypothetical protein